MASIPQEIADKAADRIEDAMAKLDASFERTAKAVERMFAPCHSMTDADRLAFLDGNRVYIEIGKHGEKNNGYIAFDGVKWESKISHRGYAVHADTFSEDMVEPATLREALDYFIKACK